MSSIYPEQGGGGAGSPPEASSLKGQVAEAREKLAEAGDAVRGETAHFVEQATETVASKVEEKTEAVSHSLDAFASAIRKAADDLGEQDQSFAAKLAGQAADGLQSFSQTLAGKSPEDLLHSARDLGRTNPTAFLAGAILAGVAIGRFARSSADHRHPESGPSVHATPAEPAAVSQAQQDDVRGEA